ncbi:hypothetical protein NQZ68_029056 [Dissostichus eleginoides]|nr:hypothetical protein NQZ68_029056 [Dissostichus eleginoides]
MAHIIFAEREMASLHPPTLKMRQRIQSAPGMSANLETKVKHASEQKTKVEYYAEIEKFIPYDPLEFERYSIPEDLIPLGSYDLPGLARFPEAPDLFEGDDFIEIAPLPNLSPVISPLQTIAQHWPLFYKHLMS